MAYLEELLPEFRKGAKIRCSNWIDGGYIQKDEEDIVNQNNYNTVIPSEDALSNRWELYKEPDLDWEYIIDNKCLCYFWNNPHGDMFMGKLERIFINERTSNFIDSRNIRWDYCRPVRKDEVTFYEEKKDENNNI